jgi:hypothetical protein
LFQKTVSRSVFAPKLVAVEPPCSSSMTEEEFAWNFIIVYIIVMLIGVIVLQRYIMK